MVGWEVVSMEMVVSILVNTELLVVASQVSLRRDRVGKSVLTRFGHAQCDK